ncbi:MAG: transporter substrate-binding domain-containing protein [Geminicoccaceae bacterium]
MLMRRSLMAAVVAAAAVGALTVPTIGQAQDPGNLIDEISQRGAIRVGVGNFVPWVFRNKEGELIGFEVDVARKLAEDMGVEVEFVPTVWDGMVPALLAGKFDVIISGMSLTPERMLKVNFTMPYASSGNMLAANRALRPDESSLDAFNDRDVTIAVVRASTAALGAQQFFPEARLRQFDAEAEVLQEVVNGNADAYVAAVPKPAADVEAYPDQLYIPVPETFSGTVEGFALRKGDPDALTFFNNWITINNSSGYLDERWLYWFTTREWADQLPPQ